MDLSHSQKHLPHTAVHDALDRLSPQLREVLLLCDVEELKYKDIAIVLDVPIGTVMSRVFRARRSLQQELKLHFGECAILAIVHESKCALFPRTRGIGYPYGEMNRRHFLYASTAAAASLRMRAQIPGFGVTRPDVAALDHDRILSAAGRYLGEKPVTITAYKAERSPGGLNDYYSEAEEWWQDETHPKGPYLRRANSINPDAFHAHRDAIVSLSLIVPALVSAWMLTKDAKYSSVAAAHLRAWFITPETRMNPSLQYGQSTPGVTPGRGSGILETVHLTEVVRAVSFLGTSAELPDSDLKTLKSWFSDYVHWMNESLTGQAERDQKDIHVTSWVMQAAEYARFANVPTVTGFCLRRFRETVITTQLSLDGDMPMERARPNPFRASLFNLDCMAAACEILSTPFESLWNFQTSDGRGMRSAVAYMYPYLADKSKWPMRADAEFFAAIPNRQIVLYFAARAYQRPEYIDAWKKLNPDPTIPEIIRAFPIRQPLLWSRRVPTV